MRRTKPKITARTPDPVHTTEPVDGLFQDTDAFEGTDVFHLYSRDGKRIGKWEAPDGVTDDTFTNAMLDLLSRREGRRLRLT